MVSYADTLYGRSTSRFSSGRIPTVGTLGVCSEEQMEPFQKAKAPSSARGFEILNGVRETLTMINAAAELSINFGVE